MNKKQFVAKSVDKAIELGLSELNLKQEDVDIKILDEGGFFRKAKVEIIYQDNEENTNADNLKSELSTKLEENVDNLEVLENKVEEVKTQENKQVNYQSEMEFLGEFLNGLFDKLNVVAQANFTVNENILSIEVKSQDANKLIGKRGEMLNALQEIITNVARNKGYRDYKIYFDVENYKDRRKETLIALAKRTADKALKINKPIKLDNMSAYERKIIHTALQDYENITTQSEGEEPFRHLVVIPTKR